MPGRAKRLERAREGVGSMHREHQRHQQSHPSTATFFDVVAVEAAGAGVQVGVGLLRSR